MRHSIILISLLATLNYSCTNDPPAPCIVSNDAIDHFKHEAAMLFLNDLYNQQGADTSLVEINSISYQQYLQALAILYDLPNIPYYDTIIQIHCQTNFTHSAVLRYHPSEAWVQNWLAGNLPTGNTTADSLILLYHLNAQHSAINESMLVSSNRPLNMRRLIQVLVELPGIEEGFPNTYYSFFTKLTGNISNNEVLFHFYYGYGDCFAGCMGYDEWRYLVNLETCSAQFLGMN
ncbi:MAG: hypothetical protein IAE67_09165 [Candidatus Competibacteraceae bacterium]|nr:hypothetical protein [Candidatus Competibacteraceae bacterium]